MFVPRHGRGHRHSPSSINYRANIDALKRVGVTDILSLSACGSLREDLPPGHFVVVDQFIDRTFAREKSFFGEGLVAHSDRGSQYASEHYQLLLEKHGITCSMSRRANCWDNAPMESFFASLKKELVHDEDYHTREQARGSIFEYIETFYNTRRRHSALGYLSPAEFEQSRRAA